MPMWPELNVIRSPTVPRGWVFPALGSGAVSLEHAGSTASAASAARTNKRRCNGDSVEGHEYRPGNESDGAIALTQVPTGRQHRRPVARQLPDYRHHGAMTRPRARRRVTASAVSARTRHVVGDAEREGPTWEAEAASPSRSTQRRRW